MTLDEFWNRVRIRQNAQYRWGQAIFDVLHGEGLLPDGFAGSVDDPYHVVRLRPAARRWVADHLILDDQDNVTGVRTT